MPVFWKIFSIVILTLGFGFVIFLIARGITLKMHEKQDVYQKDNGFQVMTILEKGKSYRITGLQACDEPLFELLYDQDQLTLIGVCVKNITITRVGCVSEYCTNHIDFNEEKERMKRTIEEKSEDLCSKILNK